MKRRKEDLKEAKAYLRRIREKGKEYFNERYNIRYKPLKPEILILVYNLVGVINILSSKKLLFRWIRLYRILNSNSILGNYILSKLNGV